MSRPQIYGICLVKNEDDIIAQTLTYAAQHCDRIFVLDNGSSDETWSIVQDLARRSSTIIPFEQSSEPYGDWLRAKVVNAVHTELSDDDWWMIVDSDEFLAEDPRPVIDAAVAEQADLISTWQIQFYFTERDLTRWERGEDCRSTPIVERGRYYVINWQEPRLFRNRRHREWDARANIKVPDWVERDCRRRIFNRHYQFRDPEQMTKRLALRHGHNLFPHVVSVNWRDSMRDSQKLTFHNDGNPWRFTPSGVLYFHRRKLYYRARSVAARLVERAGLHGSQM